MTVSADTVAESAVRGVVARVRAGHVDVVLSDVGGPRFSDGESEWGLFAASVVDGFSGEPASGALSGPSFDWVFACLDGSVRLFAVRPMQLRVASCVDENVFVVVNSVVLSVPTSGFGMLLVPPAVAVDAARFVDPDVPYATASPEQELLLRLGQRVADVGELADFIADESERLKHPGRSLRLKELRGVLLGLRESACQEFALSADELDFLLNRRSHFGWDPYDLVSVRHYLETARAVCG